jgi:hypothetical protein
MRRFQLKHLGWWTAMAGVAALVVINWMTWHKVTLRHRVLHEGIPTQAAVVELHKTAVRAVPFLPPEQKYAVTYRYGITRPLGTVTVKRTVDATTFERLAEGTAVPIRYLEFRPEVSDVVGNVWVRQRALQVLWFDTAALALLSLLLLALFKQPQHSLRPSSQGRISSATL